MAGTLNGHWSLGWICGVGFDGMSKNYWLVRCCCATIEFGLGWTVDIASGLWARLVLCTDPVYQAQGHMLVVGLWSWGSWWYWPVGLEGSCAWTVYVH